MSVKLEYIETFQNWDSVSFGLICILKKLHEFTISNLKVFSSHFAILFIKDKSEMAIQ